MKARVVGSVLVCVAWCSIGHVSEAQMLRNAAPPTGFAPYRPVYPDPFGPYDLLGGFARAAVTAPQPSGHVIIPTSANGYIYAPTYDWPQTAANFTGGMPDLNAGPMITSYNAAPVGPPAPLAPPTPDEQLERAITAFRSGQYAEAARWARSAAAADPQAGLASLVEMHALFALGRYGESATALRRAIAALPASQWGEIMNRYRDFYLVSRYTDHLAALERYVVAQPRDQAAQLLLGYHASYLGQRISAIEHLRIAVELAPSDECARALLAIDRTPIEPLTIPPPTGPREF
ncbi:MAG TPA: tetratricopeptide repeat protein [Pirellulales bacterium]|nr:tetratricopeptide repeat protein [Pirellulales bacterium]